MWKEKSYKASVTVEMSYIMPLILFVLVLLIRLSFYFHDKIILSGFIGETLVVGNQYARESGREKVDLQAFLEERIQNKLVFLHTDEIQVSEDKKQIQVQVRGKNRKMQLYLKQKANRIQPEKLLRKKRKLEIITKKGT